MPPGASLSQQQLSGYLHRINLPTQSLRPTKQLLDRIQLGHVTQIPFENLTLHHPKAKQQRDTISVELQAVYHKLVEGKRGGYCFEQNSLLAAALRSLGYDLYEGAGRVVLDAGPPDCDKMVMTGLEHHVVFVQLDGEWWLCDVGFGSMTPRQPVQLRATDDTMEQPGQWFERRLRRGVFGSKQAPADPDDAMTGYYLQRYSDTQAAWTDLYFFTTVPCFPVDYRTFNWFTSTHPGSSFKKAPMAALQTAEGRKTISPGEFSIYEGYKKVHTQDLAAGDWDALDAVLAKHFCIRWDK